MLNAKDYGNIPQNRERIYIVGFKDIEQYKNFDFPKPINLIQGITDVIDFSKRVDDSFIILKINISSITCLKNLL